jgi:hypothetical protein
MVPQNVDMQREIVISIRNCFIFGNKEQAYSFWCTGIYNAVNLKKGVLAFEKD